MWKITKWLLNMMLFIFVVVTFIACVGMVMGPVMACEKEHPTELVAAMEAARGTDEYWMSARGHPHPRTSVSKDRGGTQPHGDDLHMQYTRNNQLDGDHDPRVLLKPRRSGRTRRGRTAPRSAGMQTDRRPRSLHGGGAP